MTETVGRATEARALDDDALDEAVGGTTHTGGRFMLDVSGHNVGFSPPPPPPPATRG